jgi:hypothetical protein
MFEAQGRITTTTLCVLGGEYLELSGHLVVSLDSQFSLLASILILHNLRVWLHRLFDLLVFSLILKLNTRFWLLFALFLICHQQLGSYI